MSTTIELTRFHMRPGTEERSRLERWRAKGTARVTHPVRGTVVVPCSSKMAAIMNAAEDPDGLLRDTVLRMVGKAHMNWEAHRMVKDGEHGNL